MRSWHLDPVIASLKSIRHQLGSQHRDRLTWQNTNDLLDHSPGPTHTHVHTLATQTYTHTHTISCIFSEIYRSFFFACDVRISWGSALTACSRPLVRWGVASAALGTQRPSFDSPTLPPTDCPPHLLHHGKRWRDSRSLGSGKGVKWLISIAATLNIPAGFGSDSISRENTGGWTLLMMLAGHKQDGCVLQKYVTEKVCRSRLETGAQGHVFFFFDWNEYYYF